MIDAIGPVWLWPLLLAPFVGSFIGVLIVRLPVGAPVMVGRSACSHCGQRLSARDLIPLLSFVAARGKCRHCGQSIGRFHMLVELAAVGVAAWVVVFETDPELIWIDCGLGWTLLTLAWIDWTAMVLPDVLTLPLLVAGLGLTFQWQAEALVDHALASAVGYLSFQGLALAYRRLRGRDGLGGGDAKLIAAAGAWCGIGLLPFVVFISAVLGLLAALGLALSGRDMTSRTQIPFGPCIALAFWLAWMCGVVLEQLIQV